MLSWCRRVPQRRGCCRERWLRHKPSIASTVGPRARDRAAGATHTPVLAKGRDLLLGRLALGSAKLRCNERNKPSILCHVTVFQPDILLRRRLRLYIATPAAGDFPPSGGWPCGRPERASRKLSQDHRQGPSFGIVGWFWSVYGLLLLQPCLARAWRGPHVRYRAELSTSGNPVGSVLLQGVRGCQHQGVRLGAGRDRVLRCGRCRTGNGLVSLCMAPMIVIGTVADFVWVNSVFASSG
mmetsp:Transcript_52135/g.145519  ORF Transcript_52135/g.145519 Transcript_52135/m.145519 type:complete len:239 (-) Transcript_52135:171-887(-)